MWKIANIILIPGILLSMSLQAENLNKQAPSIVGPAIYELYTDAKNFVTHVYINGNKRKLTNAEGNGMMGRNGYRFDGPMGYKNKLILNGFLRAGKNQLKVVFEPSSILADAREQGVPRMILQDMYAHVVLTRGQLTDNTSGLESYDLEQLLLKPENNVEVLHNQLLRRFNEDNISKEVSVIYEFELADTDQVAQADLKACSLSARSTNIITATLLLNDIEILHLENNGSSRLDSFENAVKQGANTFKLNVTSVDKGEDTLDEKILYLYLACDLGTVVEKINFGPEQKRVRFGDYSNDVQINLAKIVIEKTGDYNTEFNFDL